MIKADKLIQQMVHASRERLLTVTNEEYSSVMLKAETYLLDVKVKKSLRFHIDILIQKIYSYPVIGIIIVLSKSKRFRDYVLKDVPPK